MLHAHQSTASTGLQARGDSMCPREVRIAHGLDRLLRRAAEWELRVDKRAVTDEARQGACARLEAHEPATVRHVTLPEPRAESQVARPLRGTSAPACLGHLPSAAPHSGTSVYLPTAEFRPNLADPDGRG